MAKKVALGKGIASLLKENPIAEGKIPAQQPQEPVRRDPTPTETPLMVSIDSIRLNPNQPRKIFKEKELDELSQSIKENGVIQPLIVVKTEDGFDLVAGERRLRASKKAGLDQVPVIVKRATDRDRLIMSIIENVQRSDLNCVETALAYYQLMEDFKLTQEEVAQKLGKERSSIANHLRILKLPREVVERLQREELSFGHAKVLAVEKEREKVIRLAAQAAQEELSVRELEKLLKSNRAPKASREKEENPYGDKMETFRDKLEKRTGFHFAIKAKKNGAGEVTLKFNNEAEFNDIYEFLLKR